MFKLNINLKFYMPIQNLIFKKNKSNKMLYTHLLYMKPEMSSRQEDKKPEVHKVEEVANQSSQVQF